MAFHFNHGLLGYIPAWGHIVTWLLLSWGRSCLYLSLAPSTSPLVKLQTPRAPLPTSFIINTCTALFKAGWGGLSCSSSSELQHRIPWLLPTLPRPWPRQGCPRHHFPPSPTGEERRRESPLPPNSPSARACCRSITNPLLQSQPR